MSKGTALHRVTTRTALCLFRPAAPTNLAVNRILFYGILLYYFGLSRSRTDFPAWAAIPEAFWDPIWYFRWLGLPLLSESTLEILSIAWKVALVCSALGVLTRVSTTLSFALGAYLIGLMQCFGKTHHFDYAALIVLGIMALSRSGDAVSVDRLVRNRIGWHRERDPSVAALSGEYAWPIRLVQLLTVLVFFGAGVSKLRHAGLAWIFSENMRFVLLGHHYSHEPPTRWGLYVAQVGWAPKLLGLLTVVLEIGAPLALVGRTLCRVIIPGLVMMQVGIQLLTGAFWPLWYLYIFWVPWDRLPMVHRSLRFGAGRRSSLQPAP